jgi:hypothetical protein
LERRTTSLPACRASSMMVKMQWLRVEAWFIGVSDTVRLVSPRKSYNTAGDKARFQLLAQTCAGPLHT